METDSNALSYTAPLSEYHTKRLARICRRMIERRVEESEGLMDGVRYHVAARKASGEYGYAVAHSPPFKSNAREFIHLMESLRDYVIAHDESTPIEKNRFDEFWAKLESLERELGL